MKWHLLLAGAFFIEAQSLENGHILQQGLGRAGVTAVDGGFAAQADMIQNLAQLAGNGHAGDGNGLFASW